MAVCTFPQDCWLLAFSSSTLVPLTYPSPLGFEGFGAPSGNSHGAIHQGWLCQGTVVVAMFACWFPEPFKKAFWGRRWWRGWLWAALGGASLSRGCPSPRTCTVRLAQWPCGQECRLKASRAVVLHSRAASGVLLCLGTTLAAWFGYGVLETLPLASPLMWLAVFPPYWLEAVAWWGPTGQALHWAAALPGAAGWGLKLAAMASVAHGWRFWIPSGHSSSPRHSPGFLTGLVHERPVCSNRNCTQRAHKSCLWASLSVQRLAHVFWCWGSILQPFLSKEKSSIINWIRTPSTCLLWHTCIHIIHEV